MLLSLFSSAFGMAKFFLVGPIQILSKKYPLNGILSLPFVSLVFLNLMFGVRIICVEHAFFTTYLEQGFNATKSIDPVIPTEFRLLAYLCPPFLSFAINAAKLACSTRGMETYLLKYPQFLIAPCFTPFMFEGYKDNTATNQYQLRVWKKGTLVNAIYLGCLPQCVLIVVEYYKGVPSFYFDYEDWWYDDALFKFSMQYGGIAFAFVSSTIFCFLTFRMFCSDIIFKSKCKPVHLLCCPCPQNCFADTDAHPNEIETPSALDVDNDVSEEGLSLNSSLQQSVNNNSCQIGIESCAPELLTEGIQGIAKLSVSVE